jgi:hypothetical protein
LDVLLRSRAANARWFASAKPSSVHYLKPIADFRDEVAAALPRRTATQLIELCQVESAAADDDDFYVVLLI